MKTVFNPTIVIDTREQQPWAFDPVIQVEHAALAAGDYSILTLEDVVAVERKSLGDYVNTVVHDWLRFRKELNRLGGYELACVVVEADLSDVLDHRYESEASPESVLGRTNAIFLDHGVPVFWWGKREHAIRAATNFLRLAYRKLGGMGSGSTGQV